MEYPSVNVVREVTCHLLLVSVTHARSRFSLEIYLFHAFSRLLQLKCLWHIVAAICQLVYLFLVLLGAFLQNVLSEPQGWSSKAQTF